MLCAMQNSSGQPDPPPAAHTQPPSARRWTDWPCCTHCGRPRLTVCPICGTAGDQFRLAEYLAPAAPVRGTRRATTGSPEPDEVVVEILLLCPQCDEVFPPRFYRYCPQCGHDEGTGMDVRPTAPPPLPTRPLLVLGGLITFLAALLLYLRGAFH